MVEVTFQGTPDWYGGTAGVIKNLADRSHQVTTTPFVPYKGQRVAPFTPLQEQAFSSGQQELTNPAYQDIFQRSTGAIQNALGQDITSKLQPYLEQGTANPVENAQQYMNPFNQAVIENIGKLGSRNLTENILPSVRDQFIRSGAFGSSGAPGSGSHQDITGRAIRDTQEAVTRAQSEALQSGYNKALDTSVGQQERNLQAGRLLGGATGEDINRQILGGRELQNLGSQQQGERRQGIGLLGQLGGQQQQQAQTGLNTAFADFQAEKNYPYIQAARESELVRGLNPSQTTSTTASYMPTAPQASPWSQGAGLLAGTIGSLSQRQGFASGGSVIKTKPSSIAHLRHYADGGEVSLSPIQAGINDALDTSEIQALRAHANKLSKPTMDPFWGAVAKTGFSLASKRTPGVLANLGEAAQEGLSEYHGHVANQENRELQGSNLRNMIDTTLRLQSERNRKHELEKEKFGHEKSIDLKRLGMEEEKLGMARQLHNLKLQEGESGDIESKEEKAAYKKADQEALNDNRLAIRTSDQIINTLNKLKEVNGRMKTGYGAENAFKHQGAKGAEAIGTGKQSDINLFNSLTKKLALLQEGAGKSNRAAVARLAMISGTKPELSVDTQGNKEIIEAQLKDLMSERDRAKDITENIKLSGTNRLHAPQLESKYDDWLAAGKSGKFKEFISSKSLRDEGNISSPEENISDSTEQESVDEQPELDEFKKKWIELAGSIDSKYKGLTFKEAYEKAFQEK